MHGPAPGGRATVTATPRRSAFIYLANGVHSLNYQITTPGKDYQFSRSLKPLEKHREVITPISGLHHPGSLSHHHNCISVWLTGGKLGPSDRNTISVDQKMAEITAQHTRYPSLEVAITQESLAWTADGVRLPAMRRCSEIFASMFEEPKGGIAAQRRALRRKGSVLDDNLAEVRRLEKKMGIEDKGRMDQYLTSVREAEIRTRRADAWLDTPLPAVSDADRKRTNRDIADTMAGDYFRTVYDLMVLAFQTDVTRVATFSLGGEGEAIAIPEIGITESRHQLSHHGGDAGYMEKLTNYDTFAIEQFSYFLTRLAETKDLNGKPLLGSTMALFGSGMSYGHSHGNANLPLVLAGGSDLGLKHGSHLDFNKRAKAFPRLRARRGRSAHHRALPALQPPREHGRPHEQPAAPHGPAHGRGDRQVWRQQQGDRAMKRLLSSWFFVLGSLRFVRRLPRPPAKNQELRTRTRN